MPTILEPLCCGFGKVVLLECCDRSSINKNSSVVLVGSVLKAGYERFVDVMKDGKGFDVKHKWFIVNVKKIKENLENLGKKSKEEKLKLKVEFSLAAWENLSLDQRQQHSLFDCAGCLKNEKFRKLLSLFPMKKDTVTLRKATEAGLFKSSQQEVRNLAKEKLDELNKEFSQSHGCSFQEAIGKLNNQLRKKEKVSMARNLKKTVEKHDQETIVLRAYGNDVSLNARARERSIKSMESKSNAIVRTKLKNHMVAAGTKRPLDHVGPTDSYMIDDLEGCIEKVREMKARSEQVKLKPLAEEHNLKNKKGICPGNAGQVLGKMLKERGEELNPQSSNSVTRTRKKYRRLYGDVSVPIEPTQAKIKKALNESVEKDQYSYGECIVPQEFSKLTIKEDDAGNKTIVESTFEVSGRKFSVNRIRQRLLRKTEKFLRIHDDDFYENITNEQIQSELERLKMRFCEKQPRKQLVRTLKKFNRQRFLVCWHDTSPISGSSHFLVTFSCVYDQALFMLDHEYYAKSGEHTSVQANVETPEIYILARCPSNDQQLMYSEIRLEDINELSTTPARMKGVEIKDHLRFFKGDAPACQLEAGHQKGGDFFCWGCSMDAKRCNDLGYVIAAERLDIQDRIDKLRATSYTRKCLDEQRASILAKISKDELISELHLREIEFTMNQLKPELLDLYVKEMAGVHRLPALLFYHPRLTLEDCHLEMYEIVCIEPLHAIKGHISNIYEFFPGHLPTKVQKKELENAIEVSFRKDVRTGADYRKSLVDICGLVHDKIDTEYYELLLQLVEIQEIVYLHESQRTNARIFRFFNTSFLHSLKVKKLMPKPTKKMTTRRLHGQYLHSLTGHGPMLFRIVSLPSVNAEDEERLFQPLKKLAVIASNHHPDNVLINLFIRYQVRTDFHEEVTYKESKNHQSYVTLNKAYVPLFKASLIPFEVIESQPLNYQLHLETIPDFLLIKNSWTETDRGILFHDLDEDLFENKEMHHFRSFTLREERQYLRDCWEKLINRYPERIPAFVIKDNEGNKTLLNNLERRNPHLPKKSPLTSTPAKDRKKALSRKPETNNKKSAFTDIEMDQSSITETPSTEQEEQSQEIDMVVSLVSQASTPSTMTSFTNQMENIGIESFDEFHSNRDQQSGPKNVEGGNMNKRKRKIDDKSNNRPTDISFDSKKAKESKTRTGTLKLSPDRQKSSTSPVNKEDKEIYIIKKKTTKTSEAMRKVFPDFVEDIKKFEELRAAFDSNKQMSMLKLKKVTAEWEIRVVIALDEAKNELKKFEESTIETFSPDMIPQYSNLKTKVKILEGLKKYFSRS